MALKRLSWLAFWAGICLAPAIAQPPGNGAISGTVMEGQSDEGVRKAIVTLTIEGEPRRWATARTDGSGHFQFDGLPAGTYKLRAAKNNEGTATYGAKGVHELGESITLAEGEIRGGLVLRFLRGASIEGRVFDPDGDPVGQAEIALLRRGRDQGAPILANYRGASSDERGEYRFTNIDPGRYFIRVSPGGPKFGGIPNPQRILVEQYYGGARDAKEASPVHVGDGEHLTDVDVRLAAEAAVQIHGQVLGVPEESDPAKPQVALLRVNGAFHADPGVGVQVTPADGGQIHWSQGAIAQGPEHRFEIENLPAGRYLVEASLSSGGKTYSASQIIDARSGSGDVTLTLAPAIEIHGTLRMEGTHKGSGSVEVELQRRGPAGNRVSAEVGADGHFTLAPVPPGEWNLDVRLPEGFLKSARLGDKEVRFSTFEIGANNDAALNIVASTRTASIQGEVDSTGARAGILVARADEFHGMTRYYYTAEADAQGKFHVDGIAPGRYKVFAFENMAARAFRDPEDIASLEELGETVDLTEGAMVKAHPKLIPMERAAKALQ